MVFGHCTAFSCGLHPGSWRRVIAERVIFGHGHLAAFILRMPRLALFHQHNRVCRRWKFYTASRIGRADDYPFCDRRLLAQYQNTLRPACGLGDLHVGSKSNGCSGGGSRLWVDIRGQLIRERRMGMGSRTIVLLACDGLTTADH